MRRTAVLASVLSLVASAAVLGGSTTTSATAASRWAPAAKAVIHPGVQMYTQGAQCTSNFVFTDSSGRVYVGYAAHCAGTGEATDTNGCDAGSLPLGTRVRFASGGSLVSSGTTVGRGRLVYSSWLAMQRLGTSARERLCLQRLRAGPGRPQARRQGQPERAVLGRPGRPEHAPVRRPATRSTATATPACGPV